MDLKQLNFVPYQTSSTLLKLLLATVLPICLGCNFFRSTLNVSIAFWGCVINCICIYFHICACSCTNFFLQRSTISPLPLANNSPEVCVDVSLAFRYFRVGTQNKYCDGATIRIQYNRNLSQNVFYVQEHKQCIAMWDRELMP